MYPDGSIGTFDAVCDAQAVCLLGVRIVNLSTAEAVGLLEGLLRQEAACTNPVYIVNAHSLNLASESRDYRQTLNAACRVLADGTGARWAARIRGVRMRANLVGTDLIPELFRATANRGYRYFLLGADARTIAAAASTCERLYPGWELAGFHHGYLAKPDELNSVIERINRAQPHLLLVGMGNPLQESWIHRHRNQLRVPVSMGVGGLFDHWAGNLTRAPGWVRRHGFEWLQILLQQPHKWRRYLIGNPKFLLRAVCTAPSDRRAALR